MLKIKLMRGKKIWNKGTISSTVLWKSYCPDGPAEVTLTVDRNLENTRKHEFVWADLSTRWVCIWKLWAFPWPGSDKVHALCSFVSNHGHPPPLTLTFLAWSQTCLVPEDMPGDPDGGCHFICMGSLEDWFRLPEVVSPVRKEIKMKNLSHSSAD